LKHDGANIPITEAGDYHIELDLSTPHAYTYKQYSWGLSGDAQGSWSTDKNMTWDATKKVFTITVDLVVGAVKFRANDDWAVNYGGALDALTPRRRQYCHWYSRQLYHHFRSIWVESYGY
jgi:hypothetical protein